MAKAKDGMVDPTIAAHQERLLSVSASKPYPCVLFWKGSKAGVFLPANKKQRIKDKDVKELARLVGATAVESLTGCCTKSGPGFDFQLLNADEAGDAPEPDLPKLKTGITAFLNFGKDPKKKDAKNKLVKVGPLSVAMVSSLPAMEDDEEGPTEQTAQSITPAEPPTRQPEARPKESGGDQSSFVTRFKALLPEVKTAQTADNSIAPEVKRLTSEAQALAKQKDFTGANAILDELESLVQKAMETTPQSGPQASTEGPATLWRKRVSEVEPRFNAVREANPEKQEALDKFWKMAMSHGEAEKFKPANTTLDKLEVAIAKMPTESTTANGGVDAALKQWSEARGKAIESLKALEKGIAAMKDPDGDDAIILVKAIQANLTASPTTARQVDELESYITTDDIIGEAEEPNGFGITVELRTPLLAALNRLRTEQSAVQGA